MKGGVLILGATSAIARAAAAAFAARGCSLYLAARDTDELARTASDLAIRYGVDVAFGPFDADDLPGHAKILEDAEARMGSIDGVLLAFGLLGDRGKWTREVDEALRIIQVNFTDAVSILVHCAAHFEQRRSGFIIGLSSVAGDRGRRSNYPYGAAKGALSLYLQGLRGRLHPAGVRVLTVKPGFVDTPMIYGLPGTFLVASPQRVGEAVVRALERGKDVAYVPWFWRPIMAIVKLLPEALAKRLDF